MGYLLNFGEALMKVHAEPLLRPYVELAIAYGVSVDREQLGEKLELVTRVVHFAPVDLLVYRQALLLALVGNEAAAREQLERAMHVYPGERMKLIAELKQLARRYPSELTRLLEWATSKIAERRAALDGR